MRSNLPPGDWLCPTKQCKNHTDGVFAKHLQCPRCGASRFDVVVPGITDSEESQAAKRQKTDLIGPSFPQSSSSADNDAAGDLERTGTIENLFPARAYGFISMDGGDENNLWFHMAELRSEVWNTRPPKRGERVSFWIFEQRGKTSARNVRILNDPSPIPHNLENYEGPTPYQSYTAGYRYGYKAPTPTHTQGVVPTAPTTQSVAQQPVAQPPRSSFELLAAMAQQPPAPRSAWSDSLKEQQRKAALIRAQQMQRKVAEDDTFETTCNVELPSDAESEFKRQQDEQERVKTEKAKSDDNFKRLQAMIADARAGL